MSHASPEIPTAEARHEDRIDPAKLKMLIGGEFVDGAAHVPVADPATGEVVASVPVADEAQVNAAIAAAREAFPAWRSTPWEQRVEVLNRLADAIEANADELARVIVLEQGKPYSGAHDDVIWSALWTRYFAGLRLDPDVVRDDEQARTEVHHEPLGVVAAITPWNFPFFQAVYKIAPAILAGNTVVLKPAPTTPLNALYLGALLNDIVPAGVVNVVTDDGSIGRILTSHPDVAKVSFTGSTATGKSVMKSAADTLKRVTLELGGNDAALILDDADLDKTLPEIFKWAFSNNGQVCISIKRIYVHSSIYDEVCSRLADMARQVRLGHGLDDGTELGPLQNQRQFDNAKAALEQAAKDGSVIAGGAPLEGDGFFVPPTLVRDISNDSVLVREETFAPIRPILKFDTDEEALALANDTRYGLGNSVWSRDIDRAIALANRLESGTTWVNAHFVLAPDVPFGGSKQSGMGFEFSRDGLLQFTDTRVVHVEKG